MPGQMPGGLVTLQQYLDANQPAVQRTQGALDQQALNPYQQALQGASTAATAAGQAQAQQRAQEMAQRQAMNRPGAPGPGGFDRTTTASVPYSGALANNPAAQATLQGATAGLQAAADKAGVATADPGARASTLYSMYGTAMQGGQLPYTQGDAGLDAALTGRTQAPNVAGDIAQVGQTPITPGTATATATSAENPIGRGELNPHVGPRRPGFNP